MYKRLFATALVFGLTALAPPVSAQANCGTRENVVARLAEKYGESSRGAGLQSQTRMVEIWASEDSGSWTILFTGPEGISCIGASGNNWFDRGPKLLMPMGIPS